MDPTESTHSTDLALYRDFTAAGYAPAEVRGLVRTGEIHRLHRGAYLQSPALPRDPAAVYLHRSRAAARQAPTLVISHTSAAAMHGLPLWGADLRVVHLTRPARGGSRRPAGKQIHAAPLAADEVTEIDGLTVTSIGRTLTDIGCTCSFQTSVIASDFALQNGQIAPAELGTALDRAAHRPGATAARRALLFADGRSESVGESRARAVMHLMGLPPPELQVVVSGADGAFVGRADFGYADCAVLIEFDGLQKYGRLVPPGATAGDVIAAEKIREDRLRELGFIVVRIIWRDLADPARLAARLHAALGRGRRIAELGGLAATCSCTAPVRIEG